MPLAFSFVTSIPDKLIGLSSYADSIVHAFAGAYPHERIVLITNANLDLFEKASRSPNLQIIALPKRSLLPYKLYSIAAHLRAALIARRLKAGTLVSLTSHGPLLRILRQYIIFHDMYDIDRHFRPFYHVLYSKLMLKLSVRAARGVICVSQSTLSEAATVLGRWKMKATVIKEASKYEPVEPSAIRNERIPRRILFVANVENTKNAPCLLETLRLAQQRNIELQIEWIGRDPARIVEKWITANGRLDNFIQRGRVDENELRRGYQRSEALVVTSLKEGFCLPVLEAQAFGTPVLASDIAILREVVGEGGLFFNPLNPEDCLRTIVAFLGDVAGKPLLMRRALDNARKYSWYKSARELKNFISL